MCPLVRILWILCVLYRIQIFDASLCGVSASGDALQRFFTHSLTQTLTYKPRFTGTDRWFSVLLAQLLIPRQYLHIKTHHLVEPMLFYNKGWCIHDQSVFSVSEAVALQNEWTFASASRLLTSLFRKVKTFHTVSESEFLNFRISIFIIWKLIPIYNLIYTIMYIYVFIFKWFYKQLTSVKYQNSFTVYKTPDWVNIGGVVVFAVTVGCDLQCGAAAVSIAAGSGSSWG